MKNNLHQLLNPNSISIIGASREPKKIGNIVIRNILDFGFKGKVIPINPHANKIYGLKVSHTVSEPTDLAIVSLPANLVIPNIKIAVECGIKNFVIYSAGFGETGQTGKELEKALRDYALNNSLNILGPNCLGFINSNINLNSTFGKAPKKSGNINFISQSGALATSIFDWSDNHNLGFSEFVTIGNKTCLNETDILEHWLENGIQKPIGLYLESISDGPRFMEITQKLSLVCPVFIIKPGKSVQAQNAMKSHTGAIAGEDAVINQALKQNNVIRCTSLQEMFDLAKTLSWTKPPTSPNIIIISNAGGPAVIASDSASENALTVTHIPPSVETKLKDLLPKSAALLNPIDVLGDAMADRYKIALETLCTSITTQNILIILTPQIMTEIDQTAKVIVEAKAKYNKNLVASFIGGTQAGSGQHILNHHEIPNYEFPEQALKSLGTLWVWESNRNLINDNNSRITQLIDHKYGLDINIIKSITNTSKILSSIESDKVFKAININSPKISQINSESDLLTFSKNMEKVVLKISSQKLLHKQDVGGVVKDIGTSELELKEAYKHIKSVFHQLPEETQKTAGILVQEQILETHLELIIGIKEDPTFGKVLMFGLGGTNVELIGDKNLLIFNKIPSDNEIEQLLSHSKAYKLLQGYRAGIKYELTELKQAIKKLANLVLNVNEIQEIECNPLIITKSRVWAVDGKVILK